MAGAKDKSLVGKAIEAEEAALDAEAEAVEAAELEELEDAADADELDAEAAAGDEARPDPADVSGDGDRGSDSDDGDDEDGDDEGDDASEDSLTYSNGVIEKIVAMSTREVPHVLGMKGNLWHSLQEQFGAENLTKGVTVEVTDDNRVVVNISVIIEYGAFAPAIFEDVKERVTERLASMTGLEVAGINLRIEDVVTRDEFDASRTHLIDSLTSGAAEDGAAAEE